MPLKYLIAFLFIPFSISEIHGQPLPCEGPAEMTSSCLDACIICDIDGFTGRHESSIIGEAPPGFVGDCTFRAHNMQWIAFIAGSVDLSIELAVSNCALSEGLEFGLYRGIDCDNFVRISNCFGAMSSIGPGQSGIINNLEPLVIGQYYYIVMDGSRGDNCDWTFSVLSGSTQVAPLTDSGIIEGINPTCPNRLQQYFVEPPEGATEFEWTIDGMVAGMNAPNLDYTFTNDGVYTICVTAKNACDEGPPTCQQVIVESVPVTEIEGFICEGDSYEIAGESLTQGGEYQYDLTSINGCDSTVILNLNEIATPILELDLQICEGDTIFIGTMPFTSSGNYQQILTSHQNCDSLVNLQLTTIVCNISSNDQSIPVVCNGEASGIIEFSIENGTAPFTYSWSELSGQFNGSGTITNLGELITIQNLPAGTYVINIADEFDNFDVIITEVSQPDVLSIDFTPSNYNGLNLSCSDSNDGSLSAEVSGGVPAFNYNWNNGLTGNSIATLTSGLYSVTVTDMAGCMIEESYELVAPEPVEFLAAFQDPGCDDANSGSVIASQVSGGTGSYQFRLNSSDFIGESSFGGLGGGIYTLVAIDENGCFFSKTDTLVAPQIPDISFSDPFDVSLGMAINLNPSIGNIDVASVNWSSNEELVCPACIEQNIVPLNSGFYTLEVSSIDGCVDADSIFIGVNKYRNIYTPNAFSPDFNGFNDYFTVYGGVEVAGIKQLRVFNRWGDLIYDQKEIENGIESEGWDGTFEGQPLSPGVYVWVAEIQFIDGISQTYSGDITILK